MSQCTVKLFRRALGACRRSREVTRAQAALKLCRSKRPFAVSYEAVTEGPLHRFAMRANVEIVTRVFQTQVDNVIAVSLAALSIDFSTIARCACCEQKRTQKDPHRAFNTREFLRPATAFVVGVEQLRCIILQQLPRVPRNIAASSLRDQPAPSGLFVRSRYANDAFA